ncbi:lipoyl synthase [Buchnera aphidicola (Chaitoregma tattakana)]|uniref:lipoyl synthase n=1 Tax=Buchnera aphidicola TaxID=9 RepID=UPI0031B87804
MKNVYYKNTAIFSKVYKNVLKKPNWIITKFPINNVEIKNIKHVLKKNNLYSVCEEALCPNIYECFNNKTVTFMILGNICTRKCTFCAVSKGRPNKIDKNEPRKIAKVVKEISLKHVVITSVNRDDLKDGGAKHFYECIKEIKKNNVRTTVETLVPDFKNCVDNAIDIISMSPPNIFNHNIESVPRLYKYVRKGANYKNSLNLLKKFKKRNKNVLTKSGLMVGLGENYNEIINVMQDLKKHNVDMLTIGQYLQPSQYHFPVKKYITIKEFKHLKKIATKIGFKNVFCGPLVRSSYHSDKQINEVNINTTK